MSYDYFVPIFLFISLKARQNAICGAILLTHDLKYDTKKIYFCFNVDFFCFIFTR